MRIKLINPAALDENGNPIKNFKDMMPGLTLPYLAALIGPEHDVKIINESIDELDFDEPVDLIGITAMTSRANRAYQISAKYRHKEVPVIIGGSHVSLLPEEGAQNADSVVIGESEGLWGEILYDAEKGNLRKYYKQECYQELIGLPAPRYELVDMNSYWWPIHSVQAIRGCPNNCTFCTVSKIYGHSFRCRPIEDVVSDVKKVGGQFFFVDDNILSNPDYTMDLMEAIEPLGKFWCAQGSLISASEERFLQKASSAGCRTLYLGLESLNRKARKRLGKKTDSLTEIEIAQIIKKMRRYHIEPLVSLMFGSDEEDIESMKRTIEFMIRNCIAGVYIFILTPMPSTSLRTKLEKEGRLLSNDWSKYDANHCVFEPRNMAPEQLEQTFWECQRQFYSLSSILSRYFHCPRITLLGQNLVYRATVNKSMHPMMGVPNRTLMVQILSSSAPLLNSTASRKLMKLIEN